MSFFQSADAELSQHHKPVSVLYYCITTPKCSALKQQPPYTVLTALVWAASIWMVLLTMIFSWDYLNKVMQLSDGLGGLCLVTRPLGPLSVAALSSRIARTSL